MCGTLKEVASASEHETIRGIEDQVNGLYRLNNLTRVSRSSAIWTVLTCAEDLSIRPLVQGLELTAQQDHAHSDYIVNVVRYPLRWLSGNTEGRIYTPTFDAQRYADAQNLLDLAWNYEYFACAFRYMHHGAIGIEFGGTLLRPVHGFLDRPEFEAYGFLSTSVEGPEAPPLPPEALGDFENRVQVKGARFNCDVDPAYIRRLMTLLRPSFLKRFQLPLAWRFSRYTLEEFAETFLALRAVCLINYSGRLVAIQKGCDNFGIVDSVIVQFPEDLVNRLARYSGLSTDISRAVLQDLTYGEGGIEYPDPAIQPLIPLRGGKVAIMPSIIISSSAERNFCVLLNRLAHERDGYRTMASHKEAWLKDWIVEKIKRPTVRTWSGKVPGRRDLGNVDLAIIDDEHKSCLLCELKWFINPSDPREWIEKGEEISKGISQALALRNAFTEGCSALRACLGISDSYRLSAIVTTPGWIGQSTLQNDRVPVLGTSHVATKLASCDLPTTIGWLEGREYLPVAGTHFSVVPRTFKVGRWQLEWYQIKPLVADLFFPI